MRKEELVAQHHPDTEGIWMVYGEDPNCDWGGSHHEPLLGIYEGRYGDILYYATEHMDRFWQWGAGGRIVKVEPLPIPTHEEMRAKDERRVLYEQLREEFGGR